MRKTFVSFLVIMAVTSSTRAAETMDMHDQVDDAQAPAHRVQPSASRSAVQGEGMKMTDMSSHEQAAMLRDMMRDGTSATHQDMVDMHRKMISAKTETTGESAKSFSEMNRHEKAAMVHEKADNGQSSIIHQQQTDKHRNQSAQN